MMIRHNLTETERQRLQERFVEMVASIASQEGIRCTFDVPYELAQH